MALMRSGIPLWLECLDLQNLLEQNRYRLTDPRHLFDMVPFIVKEERACIQYIRQVSVCCV